MFVCVCVCASHQAEVLKRNTGLRNLQSNVFFFKSPAVIVTVFSDVNNDGQQQGTEPVVAGAAVQLEDAAGEVVATGTSSASGLVCAHQPHTAPPLCARR